MISALGIGLGVGHRLGGTMLSQFSPRSLFAAGEVGAWYDPSDLTTLFQDAAGTTAVTTPGQVVGRINDKSGRGNHATQSGATSVRPIYRVDAGGRSYLEFDGIDDWLQTSTITPGTDKAQVFAGVRKLSDEAVGVVVESSEYSRTNKGSFYFSAPNTVEANYGISVAGATDVAARAFSTYSAPITNVFFSSYDLSKSLFADIFSTRINATNPGNITNIGNPSVGGGNFLAYPLYIGRRGGTWLPFNGNLYGLIVRFGANLSTAQISNAERWMARRTGVTI